MSVDSRETIVNMALAEIGGHPIEDFSDQTLEGRLARNLYDNALDSVLAA